MKSRIGKRIVPLVLGLLAIAPLLSAANVRDTGSLTNQKDGKSQWTGSVEQRLLGLMTIWSEAKFNFPYFDRIPDIDWDAKVQEFIPRVMKADGLDKYYDVLMEFAA